MADTAGWCLLTGFGLMAGVVCAGLTIWSATRLTFPIAVIIAGGVGFSVALWAGVHLSG